MCDQIKQDVKPKDVPKVVYKVFKTNDNLEIITPYANFPVKEKVWQKALKLTPGQIIGNYSGAVSYGAHHQGKFASFKRLKDAKECAVVRMGKVYRCEIRGDVKEARSFYGPSFLSNQIKVLERVKK